MALSSPNAGRSYEARHNQVRFWGCDRTFEASFLIDGAALTKLDQKTHDDERAMLYAFGRALNTIHDAARRAYSRVRQSVYLLVADDF